MPEYPGSNEVRQFAEPHSMHCKPFAGVDQGSQMIYRFALMPKRFYNPVKWLGNL
ncbi:hypothetical protein D3C78_1050310 [compost metagenome]